MLRLLLLSVLLATVLIPVVAGRARNGRRGLSSLVLLMLAAEVAYAFFLSYLYPRLL